MTPRMVLINLAAAAVLAVAGCASHTNPLVPVVADAPSPPAELRPPRFGELRLEDFRASRRVIEPGETVAFGFSAPEAGQYRLTLWSESGARVWSSLVEATASQKLEFQWDSRPTSGASPDLVIPAVELVHRGDRKLWDPRTFSGGEIVRPAVEFDSTGGTISYSLPEPARILIRVGSRFECLYLNLVDWSIRPNGANVERWDGRDSTGRVSLMSEQDLKVHAIGYRFPVGSVAIKGGGSRVETADDAIEHRGPPSELRHARDAEIYRGWGRPIDQLRSPGINVQSFTVAGAPGETVSFEVSPAGQLARGFADFPFEITFCVDGLILREEPRGVLPYRGALRLPDDILPGRHVVTINAGNFRNQYGTGSFEVSVSSTSAERTIPKE